MSHVDEGRLHAYLDALERDPRSVAEWQDLERHLDGCADCRDRLVEARSLRDRASAILHGSGPRNAAPPAFEELLARKRAHTVRRTVFRLNRLTAAGWAATIVMAVGVGWIARGSFEFTDRPAVRAPSLETRDATELRRGAEPSVPEPEPAEMRTADLASEAEQQVPSALAAEGGPPAQAPDAGVAPTIVRNEAPVAPPPEPSPAAGAGEVGRVAAGVRGAEAVKAVDTTTPAMTDERLRQARREEAVPRAVAAEVAGRGLAPERARVELDAVGAAESWSTGQAADPSIVWRTANLADAEDALGIPLAIHADLPVRAVETATLGDIPVIRITYELSTDDMVEVSQWRRGEGMRELEPGEINAITGSTNLFRLSGAARVYAAGERRAGYQLLAVGLAPGRTRAVLEEIG